METNYTSLAFLGVKSHCGQDFPQKRLMQSQALVKLEEDKQPDDGEIEIPSDEEFVG